VQSLSFVFLSTTDWDAPQYGSRQQIAGQWVQRGHRVLFVEVPRALHSWLSDPVGTRRALPRTGRVRHAEEGLLVYTPRPVLPIYYSPLTNWVNQRLWLRDLRRTLKSLRWQADVLWTYWPHTAYLVGRLGERVAVYHCIDDFAAAGYPLTSRQAIEGMEAAQCRKVDLVLARTASLADAKAQLNPNTHLLPGGVDADAFDPGRLPDPPAEIATLPRPRIGFVGTLDDRVDAQLLVHCAEHMPRATFVLVGPQKRHRSSLEGLHGLSNVRLFPPRPHSEVPAVLGAFDVCIIPYRVTRYTQALSPIKLYEYLAMGKPVVATDLPYVRREAHNVRIAGDAQQFLSALNEALAHRPSAREQARWRAAAEAQSWPRQVDEVERLLAPLLAR
jgi:glycosyltransferase involved in cell wall biosynthesis